MLNLQGNQNNLWDQRNLLIQDVSKYLADSDIDGPTQLKELVTRKALSESANNPTITKMDLLRALKTNEKALFPAPCLIRTNENIIPREQESNLHQSIVDASHSPVVIHADGGVGKSVFSTRINYGLPDGSESVIYDCFGDGEYRNASRYRHRHRDALVQIANELASLGLCHPLVPTPHADAPAYISAFLYRLEQSVSSLRSLNSSALLCIVIDAADNAQMAAEEAGDSRSFVRDLIREKFPDGVRLVFLCRTHRQDFLAAPPNTQRLELKPFTRSESAAFLRHSFTDAGDQDIDEFHRLSSQNPRVQALAVSSKIPLNDMLRNLGPNPTTVEDTIGHLLDFAIVKLQDAAVTAVGQAQIASICAGLAALRPLIPLSVLASISDVDEATIKSFALDLGRPLLITGGSIQFFDEPAETWFREKFKPTKLEMENFITRLKPLALHSAYVASTLPQIMLEANQLTELVELALSTNSLPIENPVDKRDVELQRLQFALKASLRAKRYADATKLALKAGGESAGDERQNNLLQSNTDLASAFMEVNQLEVLVSRRTFGSGWLGSHHAYEAALLSGRNELLGDAGSRLRMAEEWLHNWSQLSKEDRQTETLEDDDILEITTAVFNVKGANSCARHLRRWTPRTVSYRIGYLFAARFIDHSRYEDLNNFAISAGNNFWLVLAITVALRKVHRSPPKEVLERALRLVSSKHINLSETMHRDSHGEPIEIVMALVEAAHRLSVGTTETLISILTRYLPSSPPSGIASRYDTQRSLFLRAYSLRAALSGHPLKLIDLAHKNLHDELDAKKPYSEHQDIKEFKEIVGELLPWHQLRARAVIGLISNGELASSIADVQKASSQAKGMSHQESYTSDEIAIIWLDTLIATECNDAKLMETFNNWVAQLKQPLFTSTLTHLAHLGARSSRENYALECASHAFNLNNSSREDAEFVADSFIKLARSILPASRSEALAYFNYAVEVASKIGDENLARWDAFLRLAERAAAPAPQSILAYKLARCAELTYDYVARDKHFDWAATVEAIAGLCGSSSFAILSRWRDRDFGWSEHIFPIAISSLVKRNQLDPRLALILIPFRAQWEEILLLQSAVKVCANKTEQQSLVKFAYRYMVFNTQSVATWKKLKKLMVETGVLLPEIEQRIALGERAEQSKKSTEPSSNFSNTLTTRQSDNRNWIEIFKNIDLTVPNGIICAYKRFKDSEPPYYRERFFENACCYVATGNEAEFIAAFAEVVDFNLHHLSCFIEEVPENWKDRLAVKRAFSNTLKVFCSRYCMNISKNHYYESFSFKSACDLAGITENELMEVILIAFGEASGAVGANRLFKLIEFLAPQLTEVEAGDALSFGLSLLDPILESTDGDGPWSPKLTPPADIEGSLAGYVWTCLAAPKTSLRWEAAHVVRALCGNGHQKIVEYLAAFATNAPFNCFYDASLHFYELHAQQWMLIGLSAAAKDSPVTLLPYSKLLMKFALEGEPHVLIRELSKRALLTLLNAGMLPTEMGLRLKLEVINTSPLPVIEPNSDHCDETSEDSQESKEHEMKDQGEKFYFGIDIGPYWFSSLGRCFSKSQQFIEREALQVIRQDWKISSSCRWDEDARHLKKIFQGRETSHSHGSYPCSDELLFYFSYHAMMVVAGKLLKSTPTYIESYESINRFENWLSEYTLTRKDGGWLADRRDPTPLERPLWKDEKDWGGWQWSLSKNDFNQKLFSANKRVNLWGSWTYMEGRRKETIHVSSALVSPKGSLALLAALQSTDDTHNYRIPPAGNDLEIDFNGLQLKGWINDQDWHDGGCDDLDPWFGGIIYPPYKFSSQIAELMSLSADEEERQWQTGDNVTCVAWSQTWGYFKEKNDNHIEHETGARFQASFPFILEVLRKLQMELILKVEIERHRPYSQMENNDDKLGRILPSARLFLFRSDGSIHS